MLLINYWIVSITLCLPLFLNNRTVINPDDDDDATLSMWYGMVPNYFILGTEP